MSRKEPFAALSCIWTTEHPDLTLESATPDGRGGGFSRPTGFPTTLACQGRRRPALRATRWSLDESPDHLLQHLSRSSRLFFAVEEMGVDAEGDLTGGVAELARDERDVRPAGDQEAGEGVAKVVQSDRLETGSSRAGFIARRPMCGAWCGVPVRVVKT
jgi:hypothetical protein